MFKAHACIKTTYRADVDSLVDISKLALTYAASQLNTIPLNLIVTCWIHNIHRHEQTHTHTYGDTSKDKQNRPLDQKPTLQCPHIHFFWVRLSIYQACQNALQHAGFKSEFNDRKRTTDSVGYQLLKQILQKMRHRSGNISDPTTQWKTNLIISFLQHYIVQSSRGFIWNSIIKHPNLIIVNFQVNAIKPPPYSDKLSFHSISIARCQQHAKTASADQSQTCHVTQTNNSR